MREKGKEGRAAPGTTVEMACSGRVGNDTWRAKPKQTSRMEFNPVPRVGDVMLCTGVVKSLLVVKTAEDTRHAMKVVSSLQGRLLGGLIVVRQVIWGFTEYICEVVRLASLDEGGAANGKGEAQPRAETRTIPHLVELLGI